MCSDCARDWEGSVGASGKLEGKELDGGGNDDWVALGGAEKSLGGVSASMGVPAMDILGLGVLKALTCILLPLKKLWSSRDSRKSLVDCSVRAERT